MLISEPMELVSFLLNDEKRVTYTEPILISACNMAIRSVCSIRPDSSTAIQQVTLIDGVLQELPEGSLRLLDYCYRMESDSQRHPLKLISRHDLDRLDPSWATFPPGDVSELAYDERLPGMFWTIPPAVAGAVIELMVATLPEALVSLDDVFPLSSKYSPAISEYVLYLIFSRDSENSRNANRATGHLQACYQLLGMKMQSEAQVSPIRQES